MFRESLKIRVCRARLKSAETEIDLDDGCHKSRHLPPIFYSNVTFQKQIAGLSLPGWLVSRFRGISGAPQHSALAWLAVVGLLLAAVSNGAGVYLKRTGLIELDAYRAYWSFHCRAYHPSVGMAAGLQCRDLAAPSDMEQQIVSAGLQSELALTRFGSRSSIAEFALKLLKDAFGLSLVAISLALLLRQAGPRPALQTAWPPGVLLAYAGVGLLTSLTQIGRAHV